MPNSRFELQGGLGVPLESDIPYPSGPLHRTRGVHFLWAMCQLPMSCPRQGCFFFMRNGLFGQRHPLLVRRQGIRHDFACSRRQTKRQCL